MQRKRDLIWGVPLAILWVTFYPLVWLWHLPTTIRFDWLTRSIHEGPVDFDAVVRARWFPRGAFTIASGHEVDHYFELQFADGTKLVVHDDYYRTAERALEARGLLPQPVSMGSEDFGMMW